MATTKPILVKIQHKEFNVEQFVTSDNKTYRIYEQKDGIILGIKDMVSKIIQPLTDPFYFNLYAQVKGNFYRERNGNRFIAILN